MYQSTYTKKIVTTYTNNLFQYVPYINLYLNPYHKQVHQPCTRPIQITCHNNLFKQPITTTCLINIINQIISTHQDQSPRQISTICTISPRRPLTKNIPTTHNHHWDQYVLLIIYQYKYAISSINHVSTILLESASNNVPSMYQSCINYRSNYDSSVCTNITISYTSCMCQLINYMSQHVSQPYTKYIYQYNQQNSSINTTHYPWSKYYKPSHQIMFQTFTLI